MAEKGFFYTNSAAVGYSDYDFTFVFQRRSLVAGITPVAGAQGTAVVDEIDVISSPGHAKILAAALLDSILGYEQQHGTIKLNNEQVQQYEMMITRLIAKRSTKQ